MRPRSAGFTLLELLAAMALLALLLVGVWSGIRAATNTVHRGRAAVERMDGMRAAQQFLRREVTQAEALAFDEDSDGNGIVFTGTPAQLRYVAPLPGYLGRLGPQLQTLRLVRDDAAPGYRLEVAFASLPPDGSKPQAIGDPQVLLGGIRAGRFAYRGRDRDNRPTPWLNRWRDGSRPPALVRIELDMTGGGGFPTLVVPVRVDTSANSGTGLIIPNARSRGGLR